MNVSAFSLIFYILIWPSQTQVVNRFKIMHSNSYKKAGKNISAIAGSNITFHCECHSHHECSVSWVKDTCVVAQPSQGVDKCFFNDKTNCKKANVTIPLNFKCDTNRSIVISNLTVEDSGEWYCRDNTKYSSRHNVIVEPAVVNLFKLMHSSSYEKSGENITAKAGSNIKFHCECHSNHQCSVSWVKDTCVVAQPSQGVDKCFFNDKTNCKKANVTIPLNFKCDTNRSIVISNLTVEDSGEWYCRDNTKYSSRRIVIVEPAGTSSPKSSGTGSSTQQIGNTSVSAGSVKGAGPASTQQTAKPTGSEAASNNFLFLIIGAAAGCVLIITFIAVALAVKKKKPRKGGIATASPADDIVPAVEVVDPDGQYECIGQMKPSVAAGPVIEANPMYDSYEDNQNQNRNRNQNQDGGISLTQGDEGDVYSVVNKPGKSTVQASSGVVDTGGDVYSVVQKKKQDATATDGVQAGTPDHDISDVYSVVQKPGKTQQ